MRENWISVCVKMKLSRNVSICLPHLKISSKRSSGTKAAPKVEPEFEIKSKNQLGHILKKRKREKKEKKERARSNLAGIMSCKKKKGNA